jgi:hypothetical protein
VHLARRASGPGGMVVRCCLWVASSAQRMARAMVAMRLRVRRQTASKFPLRIWLAKPTVCGYLIPPSREPTTNERILLANLL